MHFWGNAFHGITGKFLHSTLASPFLGILSNSLHRFLVNFLHYNQKKSFPQQFPPDTPKKAFRTPTNKCLPGA